MSQFETPRRKLARRNLAHAERGVMSGAARWQDLLMELELVESRELTASQQAQAVPFSWPGDAARFLARYQDNPFALEAMRRKLEDVGGGTASDQELFSLLDFPLRTGTLVLLRRPDPLYAQGTLGKLEEALHGPAATSFIKIEVLWAANRQPVAGVGLHLITADGEQITKPTDARGLLHAQGLHQGLCQVGCSFLRLRAHECVKPSGAASTPASGRAGTPSGAAKVRAIVEVEAHKVKAGETLAELAHGAGLTWQELAYFNWGVRDSKQINLKLAHEVGCTQQTPDGQNYMFDDDDEPGIIYLPKAFNRSGLATGQLHTLLVEPLAPPPPREDVVVSVPRDFYENPIYGDEARLVSHAGDYDETLELVDEAHVLTAGNFVHYRFVNVPAGKCDVLVKRRQAWHRLAHLTVSPGVGQTGDTTLPAVAADELTDRHSLDTSAES